MKNCLRFVPVQVLMGVCSRSGFDWGVSCRASVLWSELTSGGSQITVNARAAGGGALPHLQKELRSHDIG